MKTCSKCKKEKSNPEFGNLRSSSDGLMYHCKVCDRQKGKLFYEETKEEKKEYYLANREHILELGKMNYLTNRDQKLAYGREYHAANQQRINEYSREWRKANPEHARELGDNWFEENYNTNPNFRIRVLLRSRMYKAIKCQGGDKDESSSGLLGCPPSYVWDHLQSLFLPGMTLENHGVLWHIDHVRPCASFDLTDPEQQKACFHWTNLQPLYALDNLKKGCKYGG